MPASCDAAKYGIDIGDSWTGAELKFSYGACADSFSRPSLPAHEAQGRASDFSQYSCTTCPWASYMIEPLETSAAANAAQCSIGMPEPPGGECHKGQDLPPFPLLPDNFEAVLPSKGGPPEGCACIPKAELHSLLGQWPDYVQSKWGEDYGSYCAAWEDGACADASSESCSSGPGHTCGTLTGCKEMWEADYDFSKDQKWCCDSWCYVNPATCTQQIANQYGFTVDPSWLDIEGLWYSYGVCESDQSFPQDPKGSPYDHTNHAVTLTSTAAYTESTCPYKVQPTGCECTGNNNALGYDEKLLHGQDYGRWCAAWEDGLVTSGPATTVQEMGGGKHTGGGTLGEGCHNHWPTYDFSKPQGWCCDAWFRGLGFRIEGLGLRV